MANCGNFLSIAIAKCGFDVGMGKMFLVYPDATPVSVSSLATATVNTAITNAGILGVIKGWHTIAGAPVAEVSVERTGTSEMKLIKQEIAADTLTFEASLLNREVLADVVGAGTLYCLLVDDMGNVFGEKAKVAGKIAPMAVNFSTKTSSSFQSDKVTDKSIAVTARYLVNEIDAVETGLEPELIASKALLTVQLGAIATQTATSLVFKLAIKDKATNKPFDGVIDQEEVSIGAEGASTFTATYSSVTGLISVTVTGTGFSTTSQKLTVSIDGAEAYAKEEVFTLGAQ